jgi:hypothetical protein
MRFASEAGRVPTSQPAGTARGYSAWLTSIAAPRETIDESVNRLANRSATTTVDLGTRFSFDPLHGQPRPERRDQHRVDRRPVHGLGERAHRARLAGLLEESRRLSLHAFE